jgi:glycosyltransferase involved in cell wall biosynthesis
LSLGKLLVCIFVVFNCFSFENKFVILIPSYNNARFFKNNLNSVIKQNYQNYRIIYIDDASTDNTYYLVQDFLKSYNKKLDVKLKRNLQNQGGLSNFYHTIHQDVMDDEIVICLDGDDQLADNNVLCFLNHIYENEVSETNQAIWLTYGQFKKTSGSLGFAKEYPKKIIENRLFREFPWRATHLKTFRAWLFKKIKKEDLLFNGSFFPFCSDLAFMFPMLEMGKNHIKYIQEVLYIYNIVNPTNVFKISRSQQDFYNQYIRSLKSYSSLD